MAVGNDWLSPVEFWKTPPGLFWWIYEAKLPPEKREKPALYGELRKMIDAAKAKEKAEHGKQSGR